MSTVLQRRITAVTATTARLVAELRELDQLREQLRKALLSAGRGPKLKQRQGAASHIARPRPNASLGVAERASQLEGRSP
jgi:hypothetical protein